MEALYQGRIENIDLPFKHQFTKQKIWIRIINKGKFLIANDKDFTNIILQFEVVDADISFETKKYVGKARNIDKTDYSIIKIDTSSKEVQISLYKSGYPNDPIIIKNVKL
ncbi:hypothetical protein ABEG63_14845 [Chryseobacterium sp. C39-AII1]|uniref:hypothetical protein n=1 Tax=Chryseobacterium sp. C39-AII1 TaxID=3080332 RepID=UPI003207B58C